VVGPAEECAVREKKFGMLLEVTGGFLNVAFAGVDPLEVGCVTCMSLQAWALVVDEFDKDIAVAAQVVDEFESPGFAIFVGCFSGVVGEGANLGLHVAAGRAEAAT
jgi:hypothetical protein